MHHSVLYELITKLSCWRMRSPTSACLVHSHALVPCLVHSHALVPCLVHSHALVPCLVHSHALICTLLGEPIHGEAVALVQPERLAEGWRSEHGCHTGH